MKVKKYLNFLLLFSFAVLLLSCGKDEKDEPSNNAEYYVKYEAYVDSPYIGNSIKYTVNTENGVQTFTSSRSFSQTFGPFKKGFQAAITVDAESWNIANCNVRIYVSRGNEPFALKANNSGEKKASISYTIDY